MNFTSTTDDSKSVAKTLHLPESEPLQAGASERIASGYDRIARTYDARLAENPTAVWMRQQLWQHYARVFEPSARVLDFTAGTGADALFLATRGIQMVALDLSPGMLAELQRGACARGLSIDTRALAAERLAELGLGEFDGALSSFAGLNTIASMPRLAQDLAHLLRPHGRVILHALNAFCLWEALIQIGHGRLPRPRATRTLIGDEHVAHRLYDPLALYRDAFSSNFLLRELYSLSVLAAPAWLQRVPDMAPQLLRMDSWVGRLARRAGDFFVMDLEKR
jgi:2-polyprenyl-3-methyl-5-hydroxy-6-metoxy-1,4-benzoquinol methylase